VLRPLLPLPLPLFADAREVAERDEFGCEDALEIFELVFRLQRVKSVNFWKLILTSKHGILVSDLCSHVSDLCSHARPPY